MYTIRKEQDSSSTKVILNRSTSLGLGITVFQFCWELHKILDLVQNVEVVENYVSCPTCPQPPPSTQISFNSGENIKKEIGRPTLKLQLPVEPVEPEFRGYLIIAVILYTKVLLSLVDIYSYMVVRTASRKESICDGWFGLYLQIALLTYNMTEIFIGAYKGTFDGSSMLLAAKTTVRAISIEMICLFLREIEFKEEMDVFSYAVLNVFFHTLNEEKRIFLRIHDERN